LTAASAAVAQIGSMRVLVIYCHPVAESFSRDF
jgi:hypothetical protein